MQQFAANDGSSETASVSFDSLPPGQYAFALAMDTYDPYYSSVTVSNLQFSLTGTAAMLFDPPPITHFGYSSGHFTLSFQSTNLCGYVIESTDSLSDPLWTVLDQMTGDGTVLSVTDTNAVVKARFYRVRPQ